MFQATEVSSLYRGKQMLLFLLPSPWPLKPAFPRITPLEND